MQSPLVYADFIVSVLATYLFEFDLPSGTFPFHTESLSIYYEAGHRFVVFVWENPSVHFITDR